uniref:C2H2-type domain-containing protein n=1 Tax=Trichogramma kaykai TaxID=54128 RepID=A0ABD2XQB8_9HYME
MRSMDSRSIFNSALRIKKEPIDEWLPENNYDIIDKKPDVNGGQYVGFPLNDSKYSQKSDLKRHINVTHNDIRHACDICGKKFLKKSNLYSHVNAFHKGTKYTCDI